MVNGLNGIKGIRDRALLLIGFAGAFRRSELVSLEYHDLEWVKEGLTIHLRRSKTDQEGVGRKIGIPWGRGLICPVRSLQAWLDISSITEGKIFRLVNRHGQIAEAGLSPQAVASIVKSRGGCAARGLSHGQRMRTGRYCHLAAFPKFGTWRAGAHLRPKFWNAAAAVPVKPSSFCFI